MDTATLDRDWRRAFAALIPGQTGTLDDFHAFFLPDALIIDEDLPFVVDTAGFRDHIGFHASGLWEFIEWQPRDVALTVEGRTGIVDCAFTFRGKPVDAGFRQRHGVCTIVCAWEGERWRCLGLHLSTLLSHIHRCSPA